MCQRRQNNFRAFAHIFCYIVILSFIGQGRGRFGGIVPKNVGGFVVESVFGIPGLGKYFVQSIQGLDYTMICGTTVFYGAFLIIANLVVDIAYGLIDPRVKLEG